MGTISALSNYYQLNNLLSSGSGSSGSSSSATSSVLQALEEALAGSASGSSSQNGASSYLLDLSPQAQALLNGTASTSTSTSSASGSSSSFVLTSAQQQAIKDIIAKYKDAPFDQATFESIQKDLAAAGLSPDALAAKDQIASFNPTNVLLGDLNGNFSTIQDPSNTLSDEKTKKSNFLESIVALWKQTSSTASSASGSSSSGSALAI